MGYSETISTYSNRTEKEQYNAALAHSKVYLDDSPRKHKLPVLRSKRIDPHYSSLRKHRSSKAGNQLLED